MESRIKIDVRATRCYQIAIGGGITMVTCASPECVGPIGLLWGIFYGPGNSGKNRFEILSCYVPAWARRNGVMRRMQTFLFEELKADALITQHGSDEGGHEYLKATGWTLHVGGFWFLINPAMEASPQ